MKKVKCINNYGYGTLTYGDVYDVISLDYDAVTYSIRNDRGRLYDYPMGLFDTYKGFSTFRDSTEEHPNLGKDINDGFKQITKEKAEKKHVPSLAYQLESAQNKIKKLEAELAEYKPVKTGNLIADSLDEIDLGEQNEAARELRESLMMCGGYSFEIVEAGTLNYRGLYLDDCYDWEIIRDDERSSILVITQEPE